jgi:molybdate transport system substrate-binding protein
MSRHSMRSLAASIIALGLMLGIALNAAAQAQLTLLSPNPIEATINKLTADFEKKSGIHVNVTYGTGVSTRKDVAAGKAQDVSLLFSPFPEALRTGNIIPNSATVIARMRLAIAVKKGAPKPDISTPDAVRRALLNAKSIVSVDPEQGSVGTAVLLALDKLEVTEQLKPRIKWVPTGGVVQDSVAKGEYELAFGPYLSDMRNPGLDIVGALSPAAAPPIDVTGFISTTTKNAEAGRALLAYLSSPEVAHVYRAAKMFAVADK